MGKLIVSFSKLPALISAKKDSVFRLIAQVCNYDPSSGLLMIREISDKPNSTDTKEWTVDINYALQEIECDCVNFLAGTVVNIDAVYRESDKLLIANDIYELKQPELVLQNMDTLKELEDI